MTINELKEKANSLPFLPGVYIMRDKTGKIIYIGKAKKLKNRVSQYFQDSAGFSEKTRKMVSKITEFDVIVSSSEFEALVLECSLIKRHMPRYNILLKDDKGYPYLRIDERESYPQITMTARGQDDGASYFGPYGGRGLTQQVMDAIRLALKLPACAKRFPRDIGKDRPCLNFHMKNCDGWCQGTHTSKEYRALISQAASLLRGHYQTVAAEIRRQMEQAAESLDFENAARLRDRMHAIEHLGAQQLVAGHGLPDTDVIGFYHNNTKGCFVVLHFSGGNLADKDYELLGTVSDLSDAVSSLVKQYYLARGGVPKEILLPCEMEDRVIFSELLLKKYGKKVVIRVPQRGESARRIELAAKNAREETERITSTEERVQGVLRLLADKLGLPDIPRRMEAYDVSNTAGKDIVSAMTVFVDGKPKKREYKRFKIEGFADQDDYAAMRQTLERRFHRYRSGEDGFSQRPDLLLIDGGAAHARTASQVLRALCLDIPVFGMVKDGKHRTRALMTSAGTEIAITGKPALYSLIGRIQEETHRFAISYHRKLRGRHVTGSELEEIPGVGEKRRQALFRHFHTLDNIRTADEAALSAVVPKHTARSIYAYYHREEST